MFLYTKSSIEIHFNDHTRHRAFYRTGENLESYLTTALSFVEPEVSLDQVDARVLATSSYIFLEKRPQSKSHFEKAIALIDQVLKE